MGKNIFFCVIFFYHTHEIFYFFSALFCVFTPLALMSRWWEFFPIFAAVKDIFPLKNLIGSIISRMKLTDLVVPIPHFFIFHLGFARSNISIFCLLFSQKKSFAVLFSMKWNAFPGPPTFLDRSSMDRFTKIAAFFFSFLSRYHLLISPEAHSDLLGIQPQVCLFYYGFLASGQSQESAVWAKLPICMSPWSQPIFEISLFACEKHIRYSPPSFFSCLVIYNSSPPRILRVTCSSWPFTGKEDSLFYQKTWLSLYMHAYPCIGSKDRGGKKSIYPYPPLAKKKSRASRRKIPHEDMDRPKEKLSSLLSSRFFGRFLPMALGWPVGPGTKCRPEEGGILVPA